MSINAGPWKRFCAVVQPARLAGTLTLAAGVLMFGTASAQDGERVTVQLRSGEKVSGALEDLEGGTLYLRASQHDQRKIAMSDVVLIDRVGGAAGLPETELRAARGAQPVVILSNGTSLEATLTDIAGGAGSADPGKAREFVFRTANGAERRLPAGEIGRVYNGNYSGRATDDAANAPSTVNGNRIRLNARERWVDTGLTVRQGQNVGFQTSGQVQLSGDGSDVAQSHGRDRSATAAPMPTVPAGALIGRIGPSGEPFAIGNLTTVAMPGTGRLYLGVNDDELSDNAGSFEVILQPSSSQR